jgi:hypothetical protein
VIRAHSDAFPGRRNTGRYCPPAVRHTLIMSTSAQSEWLTAREAAVPCSTLHVVALRVTLSYSMKLSGWQKRFTKKGADSRQQVVLDAAC